MTKTTIVAEPGEPFIEVSRRFDAPPELVLRAYTDPDLLVRWLGPRRMTLRIERMEIRDGGTWRYVHTDPEGHEYGFHGVFHGTPSIEGIVQTFEFEGAPGHVSLESLSFEGRGGSTLVRTRSVFQSVADRDAMAASGMEQGINESMDRLEELLASLRVEQGTR